MRCQGERYGTGCTKVSKNPYAENWIMWQLCYECANKIKVEHYKGKRKKGVGGKYLKEPVFKSMLEIC